MMATPIGNLEDITLRALRVLKEADIVACEDTRVSKVLLNAYELKKECISLHQHTTMEKVERLLDRVEKGEKAVYISDAGTPGMNDPGGKLVEAAYARGIRIEPIPGRNPGSPRRTRRPRPPCRACRSRQPPPRRPDARRRQHPTDASAPGACWPAASESGPSASVT